MHELPVAQSILEIALRHAESARATRITDLYMVIGQLSSVVDDSIQFYWDIISADTIAQGAQLHFRRLPAVMACRDCQQHYPLDGDDFACPNCASVSVHLVRGKEFYVEAIDVDAEE